MSVTGTTAPDSEGLARFFSPRSIALVGASDTSGWTRNVVRSLQVGGFGGEVVMVNPKHRRVAGHDAVPSLRDRPVELAYIVTGPGPVPGILDDAAAAGVRSAVVLAAGYSETGPEGRHRQQQLAEQARGLGITLLGPNSLGFVNPGQCTPYASALTAAPRRGRVGFVLQSGSLASVLLGYCAAHGVGVRLLAAMGNEAQLGSCDVAQYLLEDDETSAVALFLEAIREPNRFRQIAGEFARRGKPLVVLKSGRTPQGAQAALAHTGAFASDDAVVDAVFRHDCVVRVSGLEELVVTSAFLGGASSRLPAGRRMAVVSSSGGGGNLIADRAATLDADLTAFTETTRESLRTRLPDFATVQNPLDVTGTYLATVNDQRVSKPEDDVLEVVVQDPNLDFALLVMTPLPATRDADGGFTERRLAHLRQLTDRAPVPVFLLSLIDRELPPYAQGLLDKHALMVLPGIELGLTALGHGLTWADRRRVMPSEPTGPLAAGGPSIAVPGGTSVQDESSARELLAQFGVPVVPAELVSTEAQARSAAARFSGPVAVKVCAVGLAHKSDIGGVRLGVTGADAVVEAYEAVVRAGRSAGYDVRGALVSPMRPDGTELIVGVSRDATFGLMLTVGLGGIWVEALADRAMRPLPVDDRDVRAMLGELRGAALLFGGRGLTGVDVDAVVAAVRAVARVALKLGPRLEVVEINPLRAAAGNGAEALDVLLVTRSESRGERPEEEG